MAQRYSDFIRMQEDFLPVYDITAEQSETAWKSFIPTKQFCALLRSTLNDLTATEPTKRYSVWLRGTFGTGKSHASAVVKHLLCDPMEAIGNYVDEIPDVDLREKLIALRKKKRYFAVTIKGVEGSYDVPRFKLSLQRETMKALRTAGYESITVGSDFATALAYVEQHEKIVGEVLENDMQLRAVARTTERLKKRLAEDDSETYMQLERALHEQHSIYLSTENISDWLQEVEQKIEQTGIADGLIIFWDEFTSVIDTTKSDIKNVLQNIAEKSKHANLFLFLISHRVENSSDNNKISDRFDAIHYEMDNVSTYHIMRHTFSPKSKYDLNIMRYNMEKDMGKLFAHLCGGNEEERQNIEELFPLHPYTAFLCSKMSNWLGSANRSVLLFMNDEEHGFLGFIKDENTYDDRVLLTAERLWDFFLPQFEADSRCGMFLSTYNTYRDRVEQQGAEHLRVFKAILLLNALGMGFDKDGSSRLIVPNDENIRFLFADDNHIGNALPTVLDWLDKSDIVNRNVMGEYKIASSSYDPKEMQQEKQKVEAQYNAAVKFLEYNREQYSVLLNMFAPASTQNSKGLLNRPAKVSLCSAEDNEALMKSMMQKLVSDKPNHLHIAIVLSLTDEARDGVMQRLKDLSDNIPGLIVLLPDAVLGEKSRTQFIQQQTNYKVAKIHFNEKEADEAERQSKQHIVGWMQSLLGGSYSLYFEGMRYSDGVVNNVPRFINTTISYKIFSQGFEHVKSYRDGSESSTFFKVGSALSLAKQVMEAKTREQLLAFKGSNTPAKRVFEYNDNNLIDDGCQMSDTMLKGGSWLAAVCRKVDECMDKARKEYADRFYLSEVLADLLKPPYGMFQTSACYAAVAYALRRHRQDLFVPSTSQVISEEKLEDMIAILFKQWQEGSSMENKNLLLRFGSKEESRITELLVQIFTFAKVPGMAGTEVNSFAMARWGMQQYCKEVSGLPLWTVTHSSMSTPQLGDIMEKLLNLLSEETPTVEKIKVVVPHLDKSKVDIHDLLTTVDNYTEGFRRFVHSIEGVEIKEEWHDELMESLRKNLPSEPFFWKQTEVENRVQRFYIDKIKPAPQPSPAQPEPNTRVVYTPVVPAPLPQTGQVKQRITQSSMNQQQLKLLLVELLNSYPQIADFLDKNLD